MKNAELNLKVYRVFISVLMLISLLFNYRYQIETFHFIYKLTFSVIFSSSILFSFGYNFAGISGIIGIGIMELYGLILFFDDWRDIRFHISFSILVFIIIYLSWLCLKKTIKLNDPFNKFEKIDIEFVKQGESVNNSYISK